MKKVDDKLYIMTSKELRKSAASKFKDGTTIYVKPSAKSDFKYIIHLKKGGYKTFNFHSTVEDANTHKFLSATAGTKKGMRPYFIDDFLHR